MKKIIIISKKMESGGTEVSLLNTIKELRKHDVQITLGLLKKEGVYLEKIPKEVNVFEIFNDQEKYFNKIDIKSLKVFEFFKIIFGKILRKMSYPLFYKYLLKQKLNENNEVYDLAIDYHGYGYFGTPYIIEKVKAKKKVTFIHDEKIDWLNKVENWFGKFDKIFCVSESCKNKVLLQYSYLENKLDIFRNIVDEEKILEDAKENIEGLSNKINILTIGRLEYQKGYDLLIKVANRLDKNKFTWYIIGEGSLKNKIQEDIEKNNLQQNVVLLGMKINPYPYMKLSDIYVQPSRHEGYGIAIAEARCLNKPIIATNLECIREQITDNITGKLCEFNDEDFANSITELILNDSKRKYYQDNLKKEGFKNNNDIIKLLEE